MEIELYKETFEQEVLQSDIPVLVDFWATWCGPCKMIAPIVKEIADEYDGKILVGKVNVDEEPDLTMQYNVSSIPTLMVFKNGQLVNKAVGYREKDEILKMLPTITQNRVYRKSTHGFFICQIKAIVKILKSYSVLSLLFLRLNKQFRNQQGSLQNHKRVLQIHIH